MINRFFPQLRTGSIAQFPVRKHSAQKTILNGSISGHLIKMAAPEGARTAWDLDFTGVTDEEMDALDTLFSECEGRLHPFWFVDPVGNILRWTDDLSNPVWQTGMLVGTGVDDPSGSQLASSLTNGGQEAQAISQVVDSLAPYTYTFSVWARSSSVDSLQISIAKNGQQVTATNRLTTEWEVMTVPGELTDLAGQVSCAIEIPGGSAVDVYGPQLDAQRSASEYRSNSHRSGVYIVRFDQDELDRTTHGPDSHSTRIRVVTVKE